ncbi:Tetratricopeptide repeat protein 29 [Larimichthys crocea]|uniref:Uncharacterized protein n=1 Tax=Larimichthys crocea TaxID=215358 RepID=A0ACD3Q4V1_LARCR|nr:Tetratricopeptide repeat protein 29 [Larimichthys crocea]
MNVPLKKHDGSFLPDIRQSSTQHRSYSELFFLLLSDQSRRSADFSLAVQLQTPLDQHQDKLETIRRHLSSAEQAERSAEDKHSEAGASYQLGLGYQRAGDHTAAKQFFNRSMQMCGTLQDTEGLGKCYKAMAKSLHSEGNDAEAIRFLEKLVDICVMMPRQLVEAFLSLGHVYFTQGQYERASEFFLKSYELSCDLDDVALLQEAQVWVGSARAHSTVREYLADDVDRDRRSSGTE